jgi:hypothetical protein
MTTRRHLIGLLAVPIALGGCASGEAAARSTSGDGPPERAAMVCGAEIVGEVAQILRLDDPPDTRSTWGDDVFTCTYDLPEGPLVLAVNVSDSDQRAGAYFDSRRAETPGAQDVVGLGERAFRTGDGRVTVVKDDMTLSVDATALPDVFGDNGQTRSAFAFEVAADVMGCWTEHE